MLFTLANFRALCLIVATHFTWVFPSMPNDTHIIGLASDVLHVFLQLQEEFGALGLSM
jgi:hypothetical protein